ncbi:hypothetical protein C8R44DRAFT_776170 [Mycena epipterygia]|nr:hypothetical protein C8R44DRAFT_776170 [Mycena epipterygia]
MSTFHNSSPPRMAPVQLRARVAEICAALSQPKLILAGLEETRRLAQSQLDSMVDPVVKLPVEITSEIFTQCLPAAEDDKKSYSMEAPMLLLKVSRAWAKIALATPALWAQLHLDADRIRGSMEIETFAASWLSRTCNHPLSVTVSGWEPGKIDFVWHRAHQMESLELHVGVEDLYPSADIGSFNLLERLTLGLPLDDADLSDVTIDVFRNAPRLREVHMMEGFLPWFVVLPWQQLTKFTGTDFTVYECLEVLELTPRLVECTFAVSQLEYEDPGPSNITSHLHLKTLGFAKPTGCGLSDSILPYLRLPALETLHHVGASSFPPHHIFESFMARSLPPLKRFAFRCNYLTPPWADLLQKLPTLTDVELWYPPPILQTDFFERLKNPTPFLPRLQRLTIVELPRHNPDLKFVSSLQVRSTPDDGMPDLSSVRIFTNAEGILSNPADVNETFAPLHTDLRELTGEDPDIYIQETKDLNRYHS